MRSAVSRILFGSSTRSLDKRIAAAFLIVGPIYLFLRHFHIEILNPTNIYWLMNYDWGQHALGLHAHLHSDWAFPLTHTDKFFPPEGAAIALTDSNPLVAIPLKLFAWALPDNFQVIGPWLAVCVVFQIWVGYLLLRNYSRTRWTASLAALVFGIWPPFYFRMDHDTLVAHWLLILGMWIFVTPASAWTRCWRMTALLALSACIHPMMFLMVGLYWSADVLRLIWRTYKTPHIWRALASTALIPPTVAFLLFYLLGTLPGGTGGSWGFTEYSMNINSPINPMTDWGSRFLPALKTGPYQYEGFAYLGVGLLVLIGLAAASAMYRRLRSGRFENNTHSQTPSLYWLAPGLIICILLALSTTVRLGEHVILDIPLSRDVKQDLLGSIRASGRFIWPVAYFAIFLTMRELLKQPSYRFIAIICAAMLIQHVDLKVYSAAQQNRTGLANEISGFRLAASPHWDEILEHTDNVVFLPPQPPSDKTFFYELSWRAISHGAAINTMYMSRLNDDQRQAKTDSVRKWRSLGPQPNTLYVFFDGCSRYSRGRSDLFRLDDALILPPTEAIDALDSLSEETCR